MFELKTEHLFAYTASLSAPEVIGVLPEGIRVNFYVTGGEATGPRVRGLIRAHGGDWLVLRGDGVGQMDVRATIETDDGALIYVHYQGIADFGPDGHAAFRRGELPAIVPLRTTPVFCCAHPDYAWLQRLVCIGVGEADLARSRVRYDVYAVR